MEFANALLAAAFGSLVLVGFTVTALIVAADLVAFVRSVRGRKKKEGDDER